MPIERGPVTHADIQNAIEKGFLTVVPDFTGFADVTEYSLTQAGEEYYYNGF